MFGTEHHAFFGPIISAKQQIDPQVALADLITIARDLAEIEARTGRSEPTVIT